MNPKSRFVIHIGLFLVLTGGSSLVPTYAGDRACPSPVAQICSAEEIEAIPTATLANLNWAIQATPSGYSDFIVRGEGAFPQTDPRTGQPNLHEFISGELMMAFSYNGQSPMWSTRCPRYPDWKVPGYNYQILQAPSFTEDPDSDGLNEGTSMFGNSDIEYTVQYDMDLLDEGVAMGIGADYKLSDRFALKMTYEVYNPGPNPITDFSAFLLFHGHPGNTEIGNSNAVHDEMSYLSGALQGYRYDSTAYAEDVSGLIDNFASGSMISDYISVQSMDAAIEYGAGPYNGHGAGQPASGEHCEIEAGALGMEMSIMGAEASLSRKWSLGDIAPGEMKSFDFLITQRSESKGIDRGNLCLRWQFDFDQTNPNLMLTHGACDTPAAGTPVDIVSGSISKLAVVPDCDPTFDCTQLTDLSCVRTNYSLDRLTVDGHGHPQDARFFLARDASRFTTWGDGHLTGRTLRRFLFTPSTAPGLDVVDACPVGAGSPVDGLDSAQVQRRYSFDIDAWARTNYQHVIHRATP